MEEEEKEEEEEEEEEATSIPILNGSLRIQQIKVNSNFPFIGKKSKYVFDLFSTF